MVWQRVTRFDPRVNALADRHYSRQTPGSTQGCVPPGRGVVLYAESDTGQATWAASWQKPEYAHHAWPGAWVCTMFRNEDLGIRSSELIRQAVAACRAVMGEPPEAGMITFVNLARVRKKRDPGRCFRRAGFEVAGWTRERGYLALQLWPAAMPSPELPCGLLI